MIVRAVGWLTPNVLVFLTLIAIFTVFPKLLRFCFFGKRRFWISVSLVLVVLIFPPAPFQVVSQSLNLSNIPSQDNDAGVQRQKTQRQIENIRAHIFLTEKYGGEWQGTNDAEIRFWRREGQPDVLRKPYNPNLPENPGSWPRLTPSLCHAVRGLVIPRATIYLKIPKNIVVTSLPGHVEPPLQQKWTLALSDSKWNHYYTVVGQATETLCAGVIQSLALKFPGPDRYPVEYALSLPIGGLGDIKGTFYLEIFDAD